jgi:aminocarboxymuconate-semialdehyde decarboxylase
LVYDELTLRHLLTVFDDSQLMVGTDFSFSLSDWRPVERILQAVPDYVVRAQLLYTNA